MYGTTLKSVGRQLTTLAAVALVAACSEATPLTEAPAEETSSRSVELGSCDSLRAPADTKLSQGLYAEGVQIYRWNGAAWMFVAPSAVLLPNSNANGQVGVHYAGPTWESNSGSKVVAAVSKRCTPNANAIPWLLLGATSSEGPGMFDGTTHIQRLNTVGGLAPIAPGTTVGQEAHVPYTADYFFYRAK